MSPDTLIRLDSGIEVKKSQVAHLERHADPVGFFIVLTNGNSHPITESEFDYYLEQFKFTIRQI